MKRIVAILLTVMLTIPVWVSCDTDDDYGARFKSHSVEETV